MKFSIPFVFLIVLTGSAPAQQPLPQKCAPTVSLRQSGTGPEHFTLLVTDPSVFKKWAQEQKITVVRTYAPANLVVIRAARDELAAKVLPRPDVLFVDRNEISARDELPVPGHNLFVNRINLARLAFPQGNGDGITLSIKEHRFDSTDVDILGRASYAAGAFPQSSVHARIMATLAGGAGNADPAGLGVAWGADLISSGYNNLLPDDDYATPNISVQNHAYGLDIENYYGAGALAYDQSVVTRPELVHVFSAGNQGAETSTSGPYANLPGFANLTGNFKMAKNVLTVGAVDSFGQVLPFSSRGPAYDGRLKPDLVAFGQNGSSESAALVSGAATILQQYFREKNGFLPPSALVRAVLMNSAEDTGPAGPDYTAGFGNLDLEKAMQTVEKGHFLIHTAHQNETVSFPVILPDEVAQFKILIAWDDPPAAPGAPGALVNDLDLVLSSPDGKEWRPWIVNTAPDADSLRLAAVRGRDTLNNAEQVTLDFPVPGQYTVKIAGSKLSAASQSVSVVWQWQLRERFSWSFPVKNDPVVAGSEVLLRWESTLSDSAGTLEYRPAGAADWALIDPGIDLQQGWYRWRVPDTFSETRLRLRTGAQTFTSDTFLITPSVRMQAGFNCADSIALFWNAPGSGASYLLSGLSDRYLEPLLTTADTFIVLPKAAFPQLRFAVTPLGPHGTAGPRSPAPDIREQGVDCWFRSFLAGLNGENESELLLRIGTAYGIRAVQIEKWQSGAGFSPVRRWEPVETTEFSCTDTFPQAGPNRYRARLDLLSGPSLYSDTATVYYMDDNGLLVFPNPAPDNRFEVLVETTGDAFFVLFDGLGRLVWETALDDFPTRIELPAGWPRGAYPYFIREDGRLRKGGVLMLGF